MGPAVAKADPKALTQDAITTLCAVDPCAWAMFRRGLVPAEVRPGIESCHIEWFELLRTQFRLCIIAPRFFGKSETCVNWLAWSVIYRPGVQSMVFSATENLAGKLKRRVDGAVGDARPDLLPSREPSDTATKFTNGSVVEAAGVGASSRGLHPDLIIGDDIVDESSMSSTVRSRVNDWWIATVGGMCHSGITRSVKGVRRSFEPTRLACVGTGVHQADLLHGTLRKNTQYLWRRYAAEVEWARRPLPPSPCVEVGGSEAERLPREERSLVEYVRDRQNVDAGRERVLGMQQERPFGFRPDEPGHEQPEGPPEPALPTRTRVRLRDDGKRL